MKKQLAIAGVVAGIVTAGVAGVGIANAATTSTASTNPMSSLVDAIASKFNLNKSDVQAVFDSQKTKMEAERETKVKEEVAQLVKDGKITQAQADKINAKRAELEKQREADRTANQNLSAADRKAKRESERTSLEQWAKDNGISTEYLRYVMGGGRGHGGPGFGGEKPADTTTSTSTTAN